MLKLPSKLISSVALVGILVLALPISAILQRMDLVAINGSKVTGSHVSGQALENSTHHNNLPVRNCPMLELRAGLALFSLKPASIFTAKAPIGISASVIKQPLPDHSLIEIRNNLLTLDSHLSVLGILRI